MKKRLLLAALSCLIAGPASAQMAVIDWAAIAQMVQQLKAAQEQFALLQQTHDSFNKLTNMGDIASVLNSPGVRQALPSNFAQAEQALMGAGGSGGSSSQWEQQDTIVTPGGNDYYSKEVARVQGANAGSKSMAQQMYDGAAKRSAGIEQLRTQIGQSEDPKTIADLSARIQIEMLAAQQDVLKMQGLAMLQMAEVQTQEQRRRETFDKSVDDNITRLGGTPGTVGAQ